MSDTSLAPLLMKERELLKTELQTLKHCQVQYFAITITATGAVLGLAEKLGAGPGGGLIYLAPLVIILPCWTIFFDKATTITRIVGYSRILEHLLAGQCALSYIGWENALREFRRREHPAPRQEGAKEKARRLRSRIKWSWADSRQQGGRWDRLRSLWANLRGQWRPLAARYRKGLKPLWADLWEMAKNAARSVWLLVNFRREHRYWAINWLTFFGLGFGSLLLAGSRGAGLSSATWWALAVLFLLLSMHNADVLWSLVKGPCSYDRREDFWCEILQNMPRGAVRSDNDGETEYPACRRLCGRPERPVTARRAGPRRAPTGSARPACSR